MIQKVTLLAEPLEQLAGQSGQRASAKSLHQALARSAYRRHQAMSRRCRLFRLFGLPAGTASAPFNMLADGLDPGDEFCIHADPISLHVDPARVYITGWGAAALEEHEHSELVGTLAEHFDAEGMQLKAPGPHRWYLTSPNPQNSGFEPPENALGADIAEMMPADKDLSFWKTRLNESQMILHSHRLNARLRQQGRTGVQSLWFWGGGRLETAKADAPATVVLGEDSLLRGLAGWSGIGCVSSLAELLAEPGTGNALVVLPEGFTTSSHDPAEELCATFLEPLLAGLRAGTIAELELLGEQHLFQLERKSLGKFWRRKFAPAQAAR